MIIVPEDMLVENYGGYKSNTIHLLYLLYLCDKNF
jgi:hypothetical protein